MNHTYEAFVDIREYNDFGNSLRRILSARYEVNADSLNSADHNARDRAQSDYPRASEYDVRVTRILS